MLKQEGGFIFLICDVFEVNFTIKFLKLTFDSESLLQLIKYIIAIKKSIISMKKLK